MARNVGKSAGAIEPGQWVALVLRPRSAPMRCYVGEVQAADERGVRLTLIDWVVGAACGSDFFAPWDQITSALVATADHDKGLFVREAVQWQGHFCGSRPGAEGED